MLHQADRDSDAVDRSFYEKHPEARPLEERRRMEPARAFVLAVRLVGSDHLNLSFGVAYGLGMIRHRGSLSLWAPTRSRFPKLKNGPIRYPAGLDSLAAYLTNPFGEKPTGDIVEKLADPVKYDPHELVSGPVLQSLSEATGHPIVACLPDECLYAFAHAILSKPTVGELTRRLSLNAELDGDILVFSPVHRRAALTLQCDRENLAAFIRTARREGGISIRNVASLLNGQPTIRNPFTWPYLALNATVPRPQDAMALVRRPDAVLLLAALLPGELQRATAGILPMPDLGPAGIQAILRASLYQDNEGPPSIGSLGWEITEVLPHGTVHVGHEQMPMFGLGANLQSGPSVLADLRRMGEKSIWNGTHVEPLMMDRYTVSIGIYDPHGIDSESFTGTPITQLLPGGPAGSLSYLPSPWQVALQGGG